MRKSKENVWHIVSQDFNFDLKILHAGLVQDFNHKPANSPLDRYALAYLTDGEGTLEINGKNYRLKKGDLFLIPPATNYFEKNSTTNPYEYYCVAFYGGSCKTLLARAGFTNDNLLLSVNDNFFAEKMQEILELCQKNTFVSLAKANSAFIQILCRLYERQEANFQKIKDSHQRAVTAAQAYIHEHYQKDITAMEICKHLRLSRSYFCEIFKKVVGISLKDYILFYRINEAMRLLIHTDLPCTKIATMVGFNDYANFYRCFMLRVGKTPKSYRNGYHPVPTKEDAEKMEQAKKQSFSLKNNDFSSNNIVKTPKKGQ
jgi:AraC-like DNA-binding protein/quercetin dioxygenase-like cupin family protein